MYNSPLIRHTIFLRDSRNCLVTHVSYPLFRVPHTRVPSALSSAGQMMMAHLDPSLRGVTDGSSKLPLLRKPFRSHFRFGITLSIPLLPQTGIAAHHDSLERLPPQWSQPQAAGRCQGGIQRDGGILYLQRHRAHHPMPHPATEALCHGTQAQRLPQEGSKLHGQGDVG